MKIEIDKGKLTMRHTLAVHEGELVLITSDTKVDGAYDALNMHLEKVRVPAVTQSFGRYEEFAESGLHVVDWLKRNGVFAVLPRHANTDLQRAYEASELSSVTVYVIGERLNCADMGDLLMWRADPLTKMLATPAFPPDSPSGKNLARVGCSHLETINLLPPTTERGAWARARARDNARLLALELAPDAKFILCGRRVQDAFQIPIARRVTFGEFTPEFGSVQHAWGIECLVFPHPSPQSHLWNDWGFVNSMKDAVEQFCA